LREQRAKAPSDDLTQQNEKPEFDIFKREEKQEQDNHSEEANLDTPPFFRRRRK